MAPFEAKTSTAIDAGSNCEVSLSISPVSGAPRDRMVLLCLRHPSRPDRAQCQRTLECWAWAAPATSSFFVVLRALRRRRHFALLARGRAAPVAWGECEQLHFVREKPGRRGKLQATRRRGCTSLVLHLRSRR